MTQEAGMNRGSAFTFFRSGEISPITDLQARPVEMWLESQPLAPKSKVHIRGILSALWNYAMWKQDAPLQVNPISLVTVKGASKRIRKLRILTVEQFRLLLSQLREPYNTLALMCVCFGLRISEALALKWTDMVGAIGFEPMTSTV
jgi:integrase